MSIISNLLVCPGYDFTNVLVSVLNAVPDAVAVAFILFLLDETSVSNVAFAPSATFVEPPENDTCEAAAVNVVSPPKTEEPIPLFNITLSLYASVFKPDKFKVVSPSFSHVFVPFKSTTAYSSNISLGCSLITVDVLTR